MYGHIMYRIIAYYRIHDYITLSYFLVRTPCAPVFNFGRRDRADILDVYTRRRDRYRKTAMAATSSFNVHEPAESFQLARVPTAERIPLIRMEFHFLRICPASSAPLIRDSIPRITLPAALLSGRERLGIVDEVNLVNRDRDTTVPLPRGIIQSAGFHSVHFAKVFDIGGEISPSAYGNGYYSTKDSCALTRI